MGICNCQWAAIESKDAATQSVYGVV